MPKPVSNPKKGCGDNIVIADAWSDIRGLYAEPLHNRSQCGDFCIETLSAGSSVWMHNLLSSRNVRVNLRLTFRTQFHALPRQLSCSATIVLLNRFSQHTIEA